MINADVKALVQSKSESLEIDLKDNGRGADDMRNDGVYSAYFLQYNSKNYKVKVKVTSNGETKVIVGGRFGSYDMEYALGSKYICYLLVHIQVSMHTRDQKTKRPTEVICG